MSTGVNDTNAELTNIILYGLVGLGFCYGIYYFFPSIYYQFSISIMELKVFLFDSEMAKKVIKGAESAEASKSKIILAIAPYKIWISLSLAGIGWLWIFWLNRRMGYGLLGKGPISEWQIKHLLAQETRLTSVTLGKNLLEENYYKGDWQSPFNPVEYLLLNDIVRIKQDDGNDIALEYSIDESNVLIDYDLSKSDITKRFLDLAKIEELQSQQLGSPIPEGKLPFVSLIDEGEEYEAIVLMVLYSVFRKKESANIIKQIASAFTQFDKPRKKTLFQKYKQLDVNREVLRKTLNNLEVSSAKGRKKAEYKTARTLIRELYQGKQKQLIDNELRIHHYVDTAYIAFVAWGDRSGLPLQAGYHIWLRPINKKIRLTTLSYGLIKPHAEVAFLYSHYNFEYVLAKEGGTALSPTTKIVDEFENFLRERNIV